MNLEEQREKMGPWMPAVACGLFAIIAIIGSIWSAGKGTNISLMSFICMMPFFFFLVGLYLVKLKKDIAELRERLDAADGRSDSAVALSEH